MDTYLQMFAVLWQFFEIEVPLLRFTVGECLIGNFLVCVAIYLIRSHVFQFETHEGLPADDNPQRRLPESRGLIRR